MKIAEFADNVDPHVAAHNQLNEQPHLDLHCFLSSLWILIHFFKHLER